MDGRISAWTDGWWDGGRSGWVVGLGKGWMGGWRRRWIDTNTPQSGVELNIENGRAITCYILREPYEAASIQTRSWVRNPVRDNDKHVRPAVCGVHASTCGGGAVPGAGTAPSSYLIAPLPRRNFGWRQLCSNPALRLKHQRAPSASPSLPPSAAPSSPTPAALQPPVHPTPTRLPFPARVQQ